MNLDNKAIHIDTIVVRTTKRCYEQLVFDIMATLELWIFTARQPIVNVINGKVHRQWHQNVIHIRR